VEVLCLPAKTSRLSGFFIGANKLEYFSIKNWEKHQHYKDRNPPWIKLHKDLLHDYEFTCLHDASKLQLMLIWLLASQMDNKIPCDQNWLKNTLHIEQEINLKALSDGGFIDIASELLADCNQSAMPEAEAEAETETEKDLPENLKVSMPNDWSPNEVNQEWLNSEGIPIKNQTELIRDFIDYWRLDKSKKSDRGWQMAFRKNPIIKRKITNFKHNGGKHETNQQSNKPTTALQRHNERKLQSRTIDGETLG